MGMVSTLGRLAASRKTSYLTITQDLRSTSLVSDASAIQLWLHELPE